MSEDNLRVIWTDAELDSALAGLRSELSADERALATARTELLAAARAAGEGNPVIITEERLERRPTPRRRRLPWLAAAAAAVVAVAAVGGIVAGQLTGRDGPVPPVQIETAAQVLQRAAANIDQRETPLAEGQYRYVDTHAWWAVTSDGGNGDKHGEPGKMLTYLEEKRLERWVPAELNDEWMKRETTTGEYKWVVGSDAEAEDLNLPLPEKKTDVVRAACGDFVPERGVDRCVRPGDWDRPTPQWIATLPRDPHDLLARLREDAEPSSKDAGPLDSFALKVAAEAWRTGLLPSDVRKALFEAIALMPDVEVTEEAANLDGRKGTALGIVGGSDASSRFDIIIDRETGEYLGDRGVVLDSAGGIPAGTTMAYTAVSTAVVDGQGERPGK